jgi:hypothetical protein
MDNDINTLAMSTPKWWQDNDRHIPNPWDEIELLRKELDQMSITEAALRESLTGLSRESVEYRHKIETENADLKEELDLLIANLAAAHEDRLEEAKSVFTAKQVEIPELLRENADLKEALRDIATTAHCIAKAGPLNTPTLQDAWGKFMKIDSMASNALSKNKT